MAYEYQIPDQTQKPNQRLGEVVDHRAPPKDAENPVAIRDGDDVLIDLDKHRRGMTANPRNQQDIKRHNHDGTNSEPLQIRNLAGLIEVVSIAPTAKPVSIFGQIKIFNDGVNFRLYIYDFVNDVWGYTDLT